MYVLVGLSHQNRMEAQCLKHRTNIDIHINMITDVDAHVIS